VRPFTSTISLDEAQRRLAAAVRPIARTETVALESAAGRVAAESIASGIDVPPFARSAMDGYAVVAADTASATRSSPARLRRVGRIFTGETATVGIGAGACVEIATGAPLPAGADAVVMVEETASAGDGVEVFTPVAAGQNVGRRGGDIAAGEVVIAAGDVLTPSRVGALAAIGRADAPVFARPRVGVLSTGNEVVAPGRPLPPGHIYDVNRFTIGAVVAAHGGVAEAHVAAEDSLDALLRALDDCAAADLIVFSGGSSVGDRDLVVDAIARRGEMIFHGIAVRPGKPTAFAVVGGTPFFGMPGNPTSCLSNAYILLVPFLRALARLPAYEPRQVRAPLGRRIASAVGRHQFYTVTLKNGVALPAFKGSGDITSLSRADGYIEIPADQNVVEEGEDVVVRLFCESGNWVIGELGNWVIGDRQRSWLPVLVRVGRDRSRRTRWRLLGVPNDADMIAASSVASAISVVSACDFINSACSMNSSQPWHSSHSSATMAMRAVNSSWERERMQRAFRSSDCVLTIPIGARRGHRRTRKTLRCTQPDNRAIRQLPHINYPDYQIPQLPNSRPPPYLLPIFRSYSSSSTSAV
jgi:molybdenum cofactor synthesis domain-containing protein